jgi:hypothetical protein
MIAGANCHHATRRARDHPYLAHQLSDGEIWTAHGGVNPCGLVVRWEESKAKNSKVAHEYAKHKEHDDFILVRASGK